MEDILPANKLIFTRPEAKKLLKLSDSTSLELLNTGRLKGYRIGTHWRISRDEILRFAAEGPLQVFKNADPFLTKGNE